MFQPKYFGIKELVSEQVYNDAKSKSKLFYLFDTNMLLTLDRLREFLGCSISINTWSWGGAFNESGYRSPESTTGAELSQHRRGAAADLKFNGEWTPEKLREYMHKIGAFEPGFLNRKDKEAYPFLLIRQIEWIGSSWSSLTGEMSWFHFATNPDLYANGLDGGSTISVLGAKGSKIIS